MNAIEFNARVNNGIINIPDEYRSQLTENVKVIVLSKEEKKTDNIIDQLLDSPLPIKAAPMSREEIYERKS